MSEPLTSYIRRQTFVEKIVLSKTFWIVFILLGFTYPIYRSVHRTLPKPLPVLYELPQFKFTNEFGKTLSSQELMGKPYIISHLHSACREACELQFTELKKIQKRIRGLGTKVAILSISVLPDEDTPKKLFDLSRKMQTNPYVWSFATGNTEALNQFLMQKIRPGLKNPELLVSPYDLIQSRKLFLVDQEGRVRAMYTYDKNSINQLMIDLGLLINREQFEGGNS